MSGSRSQHTTLEEYRHAVEKLSAARELAQSTHEEAQSRGDTATAERNLSELSTALAAFKKVREGLSSMDLLRVETNAEILGEHHISFVMPRGVSIIELLQRAQEVYQETSSDPLVMPTILEIWAKNPSFQETFDSPQKREVIGCVPGLPGFTKEQQNHLLAQQGLRFATPAEASLGFALYFILTKGSFFDSRAARTSGETIGLANVGLLPVYDTNKDSQHYGAAGVKTNES